MKHPFLGEPSGDSSFGDHYNQPVLIAPRSARLSDDPAIVAMLEQAEWEQSVLVEAKRVNDESAKSPMQQVTRGQTKLVAKWTARFGAIPIEELKAILRDDLGCNAEEIRRDIAERAVVLWINANELRMKRDLKNAMKSSLA